MATITIIVIALLASYFFVVKRKPTPKNPGTLGFNGGNAIKKKSAKNTIAPINPWGATSIVHGENACNAVTAISGKRFLDSEKTIPVVPLPNCDATQCNCTYARHEDLRDEAEDRRSPSALQADLYDHTGNVNRRARKRGRRKSDWA